MNATNPNIIIGRNIRALRDKLGLTQQTLSQYLDVTREQIAYYESGERKIPSTQLSKLSDLFCIDEYDFYEEDIEARKMNIAFAFRANELTDVDLQTIAKFKRLVRNYVNMKRLGNGG
jgi:transcriptional regulator with XRE-family HTH domain